MDYRSAIMEFFLEKGVADGLNYSDDLFSGGFINSLFALEIVTYLESTFKIRIKNKDITEENFRTIDNIAELVLRIVNS